MRKLTGLIGLALLTSPAFAQLNVSQHDGSTDFTSRGIAGNQDGWAFNGYKFDRQGGGIGPGGLQGWSCLMQDQNCTTVETFQFAVMTGGLLNSGLSLTNGAPLQWPEPGDVVVGATGQFGSALSGNTPCAWIYTVTLQTAIGGEFVGGGVPGITPGDDLFTAVWLPSNALWTSDGASSHISIDLPNVNGTGREYANQSNNNGLQSQVDSEFGINWVGGSISSAGIVVGPATLADYTFPGARRYWLNRLRYNHTSRCGAIDTTGVYTSAHGATTPKNLGMAGAYPDIENASGVGGLGRLDEIYWQDNESNDFGLGTATGQVFLGFDSLALRGAFLTDALRGLGTSNFPVPPFGNLEINPAGSVFNFGGTPGLGLSITPITGAEPAGQEYVAVVPLAQDPNARAALGLNFQNFPTDPLNLLAQVARVDVAQNAASIGSCDSHSFFN